MQNLLTKLKTLAFIMLALFFSFMWVLALRYHGWATPIPKLTLQKPLVLIGLALFEFTFLIGVYKVALKLAAIPEKIFVPVVLTIYVIIQLVFVFMFPVNAYEDALIVERLAREILEKNYFSLGVGHYLGYYPNNIGITLFFAFLYSFLPNSFMTLRLFNILFNTVSAWLIYKLYKEIKPGNSNSSYGILLLAVTFLPPVILNNFTYGDIFCNTFCLAAMLASLRFTKYGRKKYAVYTALFLMLGNFMRSVALLFMAGIIIYICINITNKRNLSWKKALFAIIMIVVMFNLPIKMFSFAGVKAGIIEEPVGVHANPIWRWVNIGFPEKKLGYWDGGRNIQIFVHKFKCDKHSASKYFIDEIIDKCKKSGMKKVLKDYTKKTFWLWTEGTYSVNHYGLSQAVKKDRFLLYSTPWVKYIEPTDKTVRITLDWLLHAFNWLTLALVITCLFDAANRKDFKMELFVYVIFLYIGFYLLWEVKSRYIYGVYPIFLVMSYSSVERMYWKLKSRSLIKQDLYNKDLQSCFK